MMIVDFLKPFNGVMSPLFNGLPFQTKPVDSSQDFMKSLPFEIEEYVQQILMFIGGAGNSLDM